MFLYYYMLKHQSGGGVCSLCGSPGTTKITCPLNKDALNPNPAKHPNAATVPKLKPLEFKPLSPPKTKEEAAPPKTKEEEAMITIGNYIDRTHINMMQDLHYPAIDKTTAIDKKKVGEYTLYLNNLNLTDSDLIELADAIITIGIKMLNTRMIAEEGDNEKSFGSDEERAKYIIYSTTGAAMSPEMKALRDEFIYALGAKALEFHVNSDSYRIITRKEVILKLIKSFSLACFNKAALTLSPGNKCHNTPLEKIEAFSKDKNPTNMPDALIKKCQRYMKKTILTDVGTADLLRLEGTSLDSTIVNAVFGEVPASERAFVEKFTGDMLNWITADAARKRHMDSYLSLNDITRIITSMKTLSAVRTSKARTHLGFLKHVWEECTPAICAYIILTYVKFSSYRDVVLSN
jgi:hypothetical protein